MTEQSVMVPGPTAGSGLFQRHHTFPHSSHGSILLVIGLWTSVGDPPLWVIHVSCTSLERRRGGNENKGTSEKPILCSRETTHLEQETSKHAGQWLMGNRAGGP